MPRDPTIAEVRRRLTAPPIKVFAAFADASLVSRWLLAQGCPRAAGGIGPSIVVSQNKPGSCYPAVTPALELAGFEL